MPRGTGLRILSEKYTCAVEKWDSSKIGGKRGGSKGKQVLDSIEHVFSQIVGVNKETLITLSILRVRLNG
jgi:hypothetical protein